MGGTSSDLLPLHPTRTKRANSQWTGKNTVEPSKETGGKASRTGEGQESCKETMHRADANVRLRQATK